MTPIMFRNAAIAQRGCIAEVQIENELEAFYSKIGCEMIQFLPLGRKFLLVVDEEGKLRDWKAGFRLGAAEGIAGNALIVREKSNGDFTDCRLPAGLIAGMTQFIDLEKTPLPPPAFGIAILTDLARKASRRLAPKPCTTWNSTGKHETMPPRRGAANRKDLKMDILESQNKEHGFYGTAALYGRRKVESKWQAAFLWVAAAMPSWSPENIRDFLDGRPGRHLADQLRDCGDMAKIDPAQWLRTMYEFAVEVGIADKTPGLDLRLKADAEFRKAAESARAAEDVYWKILNGLPSEQKDTPYTAALREHVSDRIARIRLLLHDL